MCVWGGGGCSFDRVYCFTNNNNGILLERIYPPPPPPTRTLYNEQFTAMHTESNNILVYEKREQTTKYTGEGKRICAYTGE